ncbi:helix-turn-helix transcriptional regulator [Lactobacillus sp. ESL0679]|uniref:helix-turn-helix domain-containing protein n=1 Tax=Lactobacillus sp. ESL0679 TaxID=2983209 RepID=UPI0023F9C21A|nr:helix-turn-helix transcriptional regulator [Lactobacillus sp. ESL0679]MDF7682033.1 helix-turn-helix transcriptional regulator [Lactobacillus sp. ESL0679]
MSILSERLREQRIANHWSQEKLATKMEVSRQSVSKWETGDAVPDLDKLKQLSQLYAVSIDYLVGSENQTNNQAKPKYINLRELQKIYFMVATVIYCGASLYDSDLWGSLWVIYLVSGLAFEIHKFCLIKYLN